MNDKIIFKPEKGTASYKKLAAARKEKVIKQDKVQKKRKTVKTGQTKTSGKKKTSVKSKSVNEVFFNLSPKELKHTVVEMPVGIGMSSYLEKLWKEGKLCFITNK